LDKCAGQCVQSVLTATASALQHCYTDHPNRLIPDAPLALPGVLGSQSDTWPLKACCLLHGLSIKVDRGSVLKVWAGLVLHTPQPPVRLHTAESGNRATAVPQPSRYYCFLPQQTASTCPGHTSCAYWCVLWLVL
jgi:hypothetical protein